MPNIVTIAWMIQNSSLTELTTPGNIPFARTSFLIGHGDLAPRRDGDLKQCGL